jgi:hypothetical protein
MKRVPVIIGAVAVAAAIGFGAYHVVQEQSLKRGIAQTTDALQHVDQLLNDNQVETQQFLEETDIDLVASGAELAGFPEVKKIYDRISGTSKGMKAGLNEDEVTAWSELAKAVIALLSNYSPPVAAGKAIETATEKTFYDLLETYLLTSQRSELLREQWILQQELVRLQNKDPEARQDWDKILTNLFGDRAAQHEAFLKALAAAGISQQDAISNSLRNAASSSCAAAAMVASGISIVDPEESIWNAEKIPGINPDFVAALKKQYQLVSSGNVISVSNAGAVNKNGVVSYIPVFSRSTLLEIHPTALNDPTCFRPPRGMPPSGAQELINVQSEIASKLGISCCLFKSLSDAQRVLDELQHDIRSGRAVTDTDPTEQGAALLNASDLVLCEHYLVGITKTDNGFIDRTFVSTKLPIVVCPLDGQHYSWSGFGVTGEDPEYMKCQKNLIKVGRTDYAGECHTNKLKADDETWTARVVIDQSRIEGQVKTVSMNQVGSPYIRIYSFDGTIDSYDISAPIINPAFR